MVSFDSLVTLANGAVQAFVHQPQIDIYDMGMRLSVAAEVRGCQDSGWTTVFGYEEVGGLHSGEYGWYGGDYSGAVRAVRIEVWSGGGNILHGYRYFYLDSVRLWGVSQATLEVVDAQDQPVTALGLTDDGWPRPNPLTARVALHCPADAPVACLNSLKLELSSADQAARFYVYRADLDTNPTCLAGPADNDFLNSYREYRLVCDRIALQPGDSAVYRWDIWVQPSVTTTLHISATWGVGQAARAVKIEPAHIHPVLLLPGYLGTYPPRHGGKLDPLRHIYDHLIEGLERAGYETGPPGSGATLIPFGYDWRRPLGETGRVVLAGDVQQTRAAQDDPARRKGYVDYSRVDLIGHSAGGLVARAYIEDVAATNEQTVNKLITLSAPHRGIVSAYPAWYGGQLDISTDPLFVKAMLAGFIYCEADTGEERTALKAADFYDYFRSSAPSIRDFMPVTDAPPYLLRHQPPHDAYPYSLGQAPPSPFLADLNTPGGDYDVAKLGALAAIHSSFSSSEATELNYKVIAPPNDPSGRWAFGEVVLRDDLTHWEKESGDNYVQAYSADLTQVTNLPAQVADKIVSYEESVPETQGGPKRRITHNSINYRPIVVRRIISYTTGLETVVAEENFWNVDTPPGNFLGNIIETLVLVVTCSPVRTLVTTPSGQQAGLDLNNGEIIREIPQAIVSEDGTDPHLILLPDASGGTYQIQAAGVDAGAYKIGVLQIVTNTDAIAVKSFSGTAAVNEPYTYTFTVSLSHSIYLPLIFKGRNN